MDELRKVPPVTRSVIGLILITSIGPLLQLFSAYHFLLWWPAITGKFQLWRLITCFTLGGNGIQLLFDLFMLGKNMLDLEVNHFYRNTADFSWALIVIGALIMGTNHPLKATVLFRPLLSAINYLWARSNPTASVSLFGFVTVPALLLPYVYLGFDLLTGGLPLAIHSSTGLLSAHVYWYFTAILPGERNERGIRPGPRYLSTPAFLRRLLPPSVDPSVARSQQPGADDPTNSRRMLNTRWGGTAFAPRGRDFNDGRTDWAGSGAGQSIGSSSASASTTSSWTSWIQSFGAAAQGSAATDDSALRERERRDRLAALERRLQTQRANSIAGRNEAARNAPAAATQPVVQGQAGGRTFGTTALNQPSSSSSSASLRARDGGGERKSDARPDEEPLLDTSSSGGTVAEQRRHDGQSDNNRRTDDAKPKGHQWGESGRKLGE